MRTGVEGGRKALLSWRGLLGVLLFFTLIVLSCAPVHNAKIGHPGSDGVGGTVGRDPEPAETTDASTPGSEEAEDQEPLADADLAKARQAFAEGQALFGKGEYGDAKEKFDEALELILQSGFDPLGTGTLHDRFQEIIASISNYEQALASQGYQDSEGAGTEEATIDELGNIDEASLNVPLREGEAAEMREIEADIAKEAQQVGPSPQAHEVRLDINPRVLRVLEVYQTTLKDQVSAGLERSGIYLPMIEEIFSEEGVPLDLARLALVESAFKVRAYSRAKAKGLWQFIRSTGSLYGLRVDWWVDERCDPEKSTRAAARHLKDLYGAFGDWYLAMAAYNAGAAKVNRAIRKTGSKDFWAIAETRYLKRETKNYVPAFIVSNIIMDNPEKYEFQYTPAPPLQVDEVKVACIDLKLAAEWVGTTADRLAELNPELRRRITPPYDKEYALKIPAGTKDKFIAAYQSTPEENRVQYTRHTMRRGERLSTLARRYRTSVTAICEMNDIKNPRYVRTGTTLLIPAGIGFDTDSVASSGAKSSRRSKRTGKTGASHYTVRRGDTLQSIADRFSLSVTEVARINGLSSPDTIYPGQKLDVRGDDAGGEPSGKTAGKKKVVVYKVRRGDTLWDIASRFNVTIKEILSTNRISSSRRIYPGQRLKIVTGSKKGAA
jgi:membrane-bound lytic murein transglycosylase D